MEKYLSLIKYQILFLSLIFKILLYLSKYNIKNMIKIAKEDTKQLIKAI